MIEKIQNRVPNFTPGFLKKQRGEGEIIATTIIPTNISRIQSLVK